MALAKVASDSSAVPELFPFSKLGGLESLCSWVPILVCTSAVLAALDPESFDLALAAEVEISCRTRCTIGTLAKSEHPLRPTVVINIPVTAENTRMQIRCLLLMVLNVDEFVIELHLDKGFSICHKVCRTGKSLTIPGEFK